MESARTETAGATLFPLGSESSAAIKAVDGFPGYEVDAAGDVWSRRTFQGGVGLLRRKLRPRADKDGYLSVTLRRDRKPYTRKVAHVVLEAFAGPRPSGAESLHYPDRDVRNNRPDNLRWGTRRENIGDKAEAGTTAKGERHGMSRLTAEDVRHIRRLRAEGYTFRAIGEAKGISGAHAHFIIKGRYWSHV